MGLALYRKYRPQTFKDVTSQEHVKLTLEREIATDKVAHAYLFSGPRGVGKTTIARIFAKAVNCEKREKDQGNPCAQCDACVNITTGRALDVIEIDAASHTGVDTVRETIIETAKFAPSKFKYKIFIIDEAHMLTNSAWNALLKTIEEPPAHVIFILATTEVQKVPATILSRCQRFDFSRVSSNDLIKRLEYIAHEEGVKIDKDVLVQICGLSEGCVRDAESILEQLFSLGEKKITVDTASLVLPRSSVPAVLDMLEAIANNDSTKGLESIDLLVNQGIDISYFGVETLGVLRRILLVKTASESIGLEGLDEISASRLKNIASSLDVNRVLKLIDSFVKAQQGLRNVVIPQLPFEIAIVESCDFKIKVEKKDIPASEEVKKVEKAVEEKIETPSRGVDVTFEQIKSKWPDLIKMAQIENHSLPFVLSASQPVRLEGDILYVGVQYPLHRDKLNEDKCRIVLEKLLRNLHDNSIRVKGIIAGLTKIEDKDVDNVLETLGGKLIN